MIEELCIEIYRTIPSKHISACNCKEFDRNSPEIQKSFVLIRHIALRHRISLHKVAAMFPELNTGLLIDRDDNITFAGGQPHQGNVMFPCGSFAHILEFLPVLGSNQR